VETSEIPVLTKVVQKTAVPAVEPVMPDMNELVVLLKQALLPEITQLVTAQLGEQSNIALEQQQQALTEHAHTLQQTLLSQAQTQIGESIQSIEQAFREAMGNVSKQQVDGLEAQLTQMAESQLDQVQQREQAFTLGLESKATQQLQALENRLLQLSDAQQATLAATEQTLLERLEQNSQQWLDERLANLMVQQQAELESRVLALRSQLEAGLETHLQQLQEQAKSRLSASHELSAATLAADYKQSLQQVFNELTAQQLEAFKQGLQEEVSAHAPGLQEKVAALVAAQLQDMEGDMNKRLKARILEVLQGIKFVMPTV
jgi:hypothetical protein